jgi:hypothetical protein
MNAAKSIVVVVGAVVLSVYVFLTLAHSLGFLFAVACYLSTIGILTVSLMLIAMDKR